MSVKVLVAGAGLSSLNGFFTERGTHNGKPYYNLEGEPDDLGLSAIKWTVGFAPRWEMVAPDSGTAYGGAVGEEVDFPWEIEAWESVTAVAPPPAVTRSTTGMTFDKFYEVLRSILGDEEVVGMFYYSDAKLDSALRSVFLLNRGPAGYRLSEDQNEIEPAMGAGDPYALVAYGAAKILIGGDVGAVRMQTREGSVADSGQRKRDLLLELNQCIYDIQDGTAVFSTVQSFDQYVSGLRRGGALAYAGVEVTPAADIAV